MKVAVIGAGFSGLLAAYLLEKEDIDVTIYEKNENIGGHCQSIISKNIHIELGTVFSFSKYIKELLIELDIDYSERFVYKNFIDEDYKSIEQIPRENINLLIKELNRFEDIITSYTEAFRNHDYGYVPEDLLISFGEFTKKHNLLNLNELIKPFLSSFGFGNIDTVQAYYIIKTFDKETMNSFLHSNQLLFFNKGTAELIQKLSENITDIRYNLAVNNIEKLDNKVKIDTTYGSDLYDIVLISTKLNPGVIKDSLYNIAMQKIETNKFITCIYEVSNRDLVTTYFQSNLGLMDKIQFFYISKQSNRNILTAFAYGDTTKSTIIQITDDLHNLGIDIKQLITVKQWDIFPHLSLDNLTSDFYKNINDKQEYCDIQLIGTLVSEPSLDNLYISIKDTINHIVKNKKS